MPPKLSTDIITAAIAGFEQQKAHIDAQIAELRSLLSGGSAEPAAASVPAKRKRRKMSAAGRARIAEAQRKRWAGVKGQSAAPTPEPAKPKRKLSAAGRKAIVAASKKRWALHRAEAAKSGSAAKSRPAKAAVKNATAKKATVKKGAARAAKKTAKVPAQTAVVETGAQ